MSDFLAALASVCLVFDGAFGTGSSSATSDPDDFGGPDLEGCNELLNLTRPDVIAELHDAFFGVGGDAVETNTFGAFPIVLAEYAIPERTFELARAGAAIAREVADGFSTPEPPALRGRLDRAGHQAPVARRTSASPSCATPTR